MKVSIIIPVYNAETKIKQALDSILKQTYSSFEVIIVNDGSTDQTLHFCEQYAAEHGNITLVTIENSGPGHARNVGLDKVSGEYISFVDADDTLATDFLEKMVFIAQKHTYDIVSSTHYRVDEELKEASTSFTTGVVDKYGSLEEQKRYHEFKTSGTFGYVWGKLYKTSFIKKHHIHFSEERQVFLEDTLFNLKAIAFNPSYYVLNEPLYYYYIYEDSLSQKTEDITERAIQLLENYVRFLKETDKYEENIDLLIPLTYRVISWSLFKTLEHNSQLKVINEKVGCFSNNETVQIITRNKETTKEISKIKSLPQRLLYRFIAFTMRHQFDKTLGLFFYVSYPVFSLYIKQAVQA